MIVAKSGTPGEHESRGKGTPAPFAAIDGALPAASVSSPAEYTLQSFGAHNAIVVTVTEQRQISVAALLQELLEDDAAGLIAVLDGLGRRGSRNVPGRFSVALFLDSNNKARSPADADEPGETTQQDDFDEHNLTFAKAEHAFIACAKLVRKAKDAGLDLLKDSSHWRLYQSDAVAQFSPAEFDILQKLKLQDGACRCEFGALCINNRGHLRWLELSIVARQHDWAFADVPLVAA